MKGIKDLANDLAVKRGIPKTEAADIARDFVEVLSSAIVGGGVQLKGVMTIKPTLRKGRTGTIPTGEKKGQTWQSEDKYVLSISTGSDMAAELNK